MTNWKISPSDLTFLWDECQRCFYVKIVHQFNRPATIMPSIFQRIDKLMKDFFEGKPTEALTPELPPGNVLFGEKWVVSNPIILPGHTSTCYLRGKFDTTVAFMDGTYGVVDFKTTETKPDHIPFYSRQLHAYAYALEHPAPDKLYLSPITRLGLLCVEPVKMDKTSAGQIAYLGDVTWLECIKDEPGFLSFMDQVLTLLESPILPESSEKCPFCKYLRNSQENPLLSN